MTIKQPIERTVQKLLLPRVPATTAFLRCTDLYCGDGEIDDAGIAAGLEVANAYDPGLDVATVEQISNQSPTSVVQVLMANQRRVLSTEQIYELVSALGKAHFDPRAKRDRNLVNQDLSDLAGCTTQGCSKSVPQLLPGSAAVFACFVCRTSPWTWRCCGNTWSCRAAGRYLNRDQENLGAATANVFRHTAPVWAMEID